MKSQVYTKTGDDGTTGLIGGTRIQKDDLRLEAYGTIDELNSNIGMIWSFDVGEKVAKELQKVQSRLFVIGAYMATDEKVSDFKSKLKNGSDDIELLENWMDQMEADLPKLSSFILPGGHPAVSACHISRTVCRRAERCAVRLSRSCEMEGWILRYLNRLSDYLFVLSRYLTNNFQISEIPWRAEL